MRNYSREHLAAVLEQVRTHHCAYTLPGHSTNEPCDCKYGGRDIRSGPQVEEGNGCPELRDIVGLLRTMNDTEFNRILNRAYIKNTLPKVQ